MNEKSKYSFLLPAYKARFFEEALGSILAQTYQDFNVIVSDDCSPEDLKSIVDKFHDPRVTYQRNEKNIGAEHLVDHWNMLLGLTDAEYIIMASDDDVYEPSFLQQIDDLIERWPSVSVFRGRMRRIDSDSKEIRREDVFEKEWFSAEDALSKYVIDEISSGMPQYVFNNEILKSLGGFSWCPSAWYSDDLTVYKSMVANHSGIAITKEIAFSFRDSGINISAIRRDKKNIDSKVRAVGYYERELTQILRQLKNGAFLENQFRDRARSATCDIIEHQGFSIFIWGLSKCLLSSSKWLSFSWCVSVLFRHIYRHFSEGKILKRTKCI